MSAILAIEPVKPSRCPECKESSISSKWSNQGNRVLEHYCQDCGWSGQAFIPPRKKIITTRDCSVGNFGGFHYELFDQYGHCAVSSQYFSTDKACTDAAIAELKNLSGRPGYGKCTAVIWPSRVTARARKITDQQVHLSTHTDPDARRK